MTVQAIQDTTIIDVPLILDSIESSSDAKNLWVTGEKPENSLLARFSIKPVQVAEVAPTGAEKGQTLLWRAFAGGGVTVLRADELHLETGPKYFCGAGNGGRTFSCLIDEDGNGSFDHAAEAVTERGSKPYHITIIKAVRSLDTPRPYHIVADDLRPAITVELRNCAKDYDRPRFVALSTVDRNVPLATSALVWQAKDSSFANCRRGSRLDDLAGRAISIPDGGYLAQMGPLAFTVGPKNDARLALVGPVDPLALYRLEGSSLVDMSIGHTPRQAQLIALKKFPYPIMMTDEGAVVRDGPLAVGGLLATIPFHHAYRGKLTQDIAISTLFGKRSLAAGTVVYGFPARSRISRTVRGLPEPQIVSDREYRTINLQLTWCAPVHDGATREEKPNAVGKNGWSAACIPHSTLGNHTIITDLQPAFGVSGVSYNVETSSNDGPPPIERDDDSAFGQPLRIDYVYEGSDGEFVSLSERIYFGGELASSMPKKLYAPLGKVIAKIAGAQVELTKAEAGTLSVQSTGLPVTGSNPLLTWDQNALLLQQLQKMGLRVADPATDSSGNLSEENAPGIAN